MKGWCVFVGGVVWFWRKCARDMIFSRIFLFIYFIYVSVRFKFLLIYYFFLVVVADCCNWLFRQKQKRKTNVLYRWFLFRWFWIIFNKFFSRFVTTKKRCFFFVFYRLQTRSTHNKYKWLSDREWVLKYVEYTRYWRQRSTKTKS